MGFQVALRPHADVVPTPTPQSVLARDVELPHVLAILEPIWKTKTETASRLHGRIESVLTGPLHAGTGKG